MQVFNESPNTPVAEFRSKQEMSEHSVIDTTVSFERHVAKGGHSSHYGVQAVILHETCCVIDIYSNMCRACDRM